MSSNKLEVLDMGVLIPFQPNLQTMATIVVKSIAKYFIKFKCLKLGVNAFIILKDPFVGHVLLVR